MLPVVVVLFECAILAVFKSTGTMDVGNFVASVLIMLHSLIVIAWVSQNKKLRNYSKYLIMGFLFRLALEFIDVLAYPGVVIPQGHGDEDAFYNAAIQYVEYGFARGGFFPELMGRLFRIIGTNRLYGQYLCLLCSLVALVYLAYALSLLDVAVNNKVRVYQVVCILPNFALQSSFFMREAVVTMFLSISIYYYIRWVREKKESYFFLAAGFVLPAAAFHSGTLAAIVGYVIIRLIYDNRKEKITFSVKNILFSAILVFLAVYIVIYSNGQFTGKFARVDTLEDIANINSAGDSTYAQYVGNSDNLVNFLIYTPLRLFFFLFSPVPWLWRGIADIIAFCFSSLYYLVIIWSVFKYWRTGERRNKNMVISLFILAFAITFVFAWGTSNAGTATRHRDKMVTLFALLWALALKRKDRKTVNKGKTVRRYAQEL